MGLFLRYSAKEEKAFQKEFELEEVLHPLGYPYRLLQVLTRDGKERFVLARTKEEAEELIGQDKGRASFVLVPDLVKKMGHNCTHGFLRLFGDRWIVKKGIVFYGNGPSVF